MQQTSAASSFTDASVAPLRAFLRTGDELAPAIARVALGLVVLPHGLQKAFGWFGGHGFSNTMQWFTETMHFPWLLGFAVILVETLGCLALVVGFATRLMALALGIVFVVATITVHAPNGFFMNWFNKQAGEGMEYSLLILSLVAIVLLRGAGAVSVDRSLSR